jgi:predicted small secreted protein
MKKTFLSILILAVALILAAGCNSSKPPGKTTDKAAAAKSETKGAAKGDGKAAVAPGTPADASVLDEVKDIYVCKQNQMYISESEEVGAICPDGSKVLDWVEKMIDDGWTREDILELVQNLQMGRPMAQANGQPECAQDGALKVEGFIMSYCPYGVRWVTDTLDPMINNMGNALDYMPYFIMQKTPEGVLSAMHGQKEVDENLRMICIRDKWSVDKWHEYTQCFAKEIFNNREAPKDWTFCAKQVGIDPAAVEKCFKNEAAALAEKDVQLVMKYGAGASPTAVYNCNKNIVGAIPFQNIKSTLCRMIPDPKPEACTRS